MCLCFITFCLGSNVLGAALGSIRGLVHDPDHLPIADASVTVQSVTSDYKLTTQTGPAGDFLLDAVPVGEYVIKIERSGFVAQQESVIINSSSSPILHF